MPKLQQLSEGMKSSSASKAQCRHKTWRLDEKTVQNEKHSERCKWTIEGYVNALCKYYVMCIPPAYCRVLQWRFLLLNGMLNTKCIIAVSLILLPTEIVILERVYFINVIFVISIFHSSSIMKLYFQINCYKCIFSSIRYWVDEFHYFCRLFFKISGYVEEYANMCNVSV